MGRLMMGICGSMMGILGYMLICDGYIWMYDRYKRVFVDVWWVYLYV